MLLPQFHRHLFFCFLTYINKYTNKQKQEIKKTLICSDFFSPKTFIYRIELSKFHHLLLLSTGIIPLTSSWAQSTKYIIVILRISSYFLRLTSLGTTDVFSSGSDLLFQRLSLGLVFMTSSSCCTPHKRLENCVNYSLIGRE